MLDGWAIFHFHLFSLKCFELNSRRRLSILPNPSFLHAVPPPNTVLDVLDLLSHIMATRVADTSVWKLTRDGSSEFLL